MLKRDPVTPSKFYKIRSNKSGYFSNGKATSAVIESTNHLWSSQWQVHGKTWSNSATLRQFLSLVAKKHGIPSDWEVIEYQVTPCEPKPASEYVTPTTVMKVLGK
jgi:hypothetical protein